MATLLLAVIYLMAIGLGVPDSAFGVAWPTMRVEFGCEISMQNFATMTVFGCTIISSLLSARVINKFGTKWVTAVSTTMTAVALFGYSFSPNFWLICLFAIPLGLGAGAIDTALNNYMSIHYKATFMNFFHCCYGIGVMVSPFVMRFALELRTWRFGYLIVAIIQGTLALISILSIPLWGKVNNDKQQEDERQQALPILKTFSIRGVIFACLLLFASTGIEGLCLNWNSSFLVESKGFLPEIAAGTVTIYYFGLTAGRFCSGVFSKFATPWTLLKVGLTVLITGVILIFVNNTAFSYISLFMVGFGVAPLFPNVIYLIPHIFGVEYSRSVTGVVMTCANIGMVLAPVLFGFVAGWISTDIYPIFLIVFFAIAVFAFVFLNISVKKKNDKTAVSEKAE